MKHSVITRAGLRGLPLPPVAADGDKDERGLALVVGGSARVPAGVLLAGEAALRAGCGKLRIATAAAVGTQLEVAVPEALVVAMPEGRTGELAGRRGLFEQLAHRLSDVRGCVVNPGMMSIWAAHALAVGVASHLPDDAALVLDAAAVEALAGEPACLHHLEERLVLTPHAGAMATLLGVDRKDVQAAPADSNA